MGDGDAARSESVQARDESAWERQASVRAGLSGLVLEERLAGRGAGSAVYRGRWQRATTVVKVVRADGHAGHQCLGRVMEMAVLSAARHPNIVRLFACLTDMVEERAPGGEAGGNGTSAGSSTGSAASLGSASPGGGAPARPAPLLYRALTPHEAAMGPLGPPTCDLLVMEFCDRGTLAGALETGLLIGASGTTIDAVAACTLLLDVASALQFLHSIRLAHGDLTLESVLLTSALDRRIGLVAKLSGFKSAQLHDEGGRAIRLVVAPAADGHADGGEPLGCADAVPAAAQQRLWMATADDGLGASLADDVHAFGTLLWRVFSTRPAGYNSSTAAANAVPPAVANLAAWCWSPDPRTRPNMDAAACALKRIAAAAASATGVF